MTTKLKILFAFTGITYPVVKFLIPLYMLYKMYGANITNMIFFIVAGLLSMWLGPKIIGGFVYIFLNNKEKKWINEQIIISELKNLNI